MQTLDQVLRTIDPIEAQQLTTGKNINDLSDELIADINQNSLSTIAMPRNFFPDDQDIVIRKHHRFSSMPLHTHDFVELNYIYSGTCIQHINGKRIILPAHSLIMLDKSVTQSIEYMNKSDILVNILLRDGNSLNSVLENISSSQNIVTKFMYNASQIGSIHDNFIVFDLNDNEYAKKLVECMLLKGFSGDIAQNSPLRNLYALLVPELISCIEQETINFNREKEDDILPLLKYIDQNFRTVTLSQVAAHFGYNTNYLGNKLRSQTGQSFQELIDYKKFSMATSLLQSTSYSNEKIADYVGYSSSPSLFRLFKRITGGTPREYREKYHGVLNSDK